MASQIVEISGGFLHGITATNLFSPVSPYDVNDPKYQQVVTFVGQSILAGSSFDFSNTILGRALGPNTPLQKVANKQLAKEFAYRIGSSLRNNVLPSIDLNNLFKGDPTKKILTRANYWDITKEERLGFSQLVQILTGFENGKNPFVRVGNGFTSAMSNAEYLENSGDGTIETYNKLTTQNKYKPDQLVDGAGNVSTERDRGYINNQDGPLSAIDNANQLATDIEKFNPITTPIDKFFYKKGNIVGTRLNSVTGENDPYGILDFTQKIVNQSQLDVNLNPSDNGDIVGNNINVEAKSYKGKELNSDGSVKEISKGRNIKDGGGAFKRTWTRNEKYDTYEDVIRHRRLDASTKSTLKDPGVIKFHPTLDNEGNIDVKGMMFSIENLAYVNSEVDLPTHEIGLKGGRIMWFPPYELTITESVRANWDSVNFIGRSEPIYTYNGGERSVNIGFKLIVDHPSNINNLNLTSTEGINEVGNYDKFFAGLFLPSGNKGITETQRAELEIQNKKLEGQTQVKQTTTPNFPYTESAPLKVYFDNNDSTIKINLIDSGSGNAASNTTLCASTISLSNFITKDVGGKKCTINIVGRTSTLGDPTDNETLGLERAEAYRDYLLSFITQDDPSEIDKIDDTNRWNLESKGESGAQFSASSLNTVVRDATDRVVEVYLTYNPSLDVDVTSSIETKQSKDNRAESLALAEEALRNSLSNQYKDGGESRYFEQLKKEDPLIFEKYFDKIKYFHPVFHSQTPEDLNSRLTFLHQCTKQGKSIDSSQNSIFGRAPVCVLRIGDFFHTQIIIESVQISYEPLLWDLNPEGIGVQPMLCDVTLDCKVIGGQSLDKPLQELQTALSNNFYANTELFRKTKYKK